MANYTVVSGDTLWDLAKKYNTTVAQLVAWNDITDPDYIVVGQVLSIDGAASTKTTNTTSRATIKVFGLQSGTDRTMYATWTWDTSNTDNYSVMWYYDTGDGVWFVGSDGTEKYKQATYTAPSNAKRVKFKVKPIAKKRKVNDKEVAYWTASWSTEQTYDFSSNPPTTPPVPTVKVDKYTLNAKLENLSTTINATDIQFQVVKNDEKVCKTGIASIKTTTASYSCTVDAGGEYKVRCRSKKGNKYSEWSEYSDNVKTIPATPSGFTACRALTETSVYLAWNAVKTAETYDIQYTTDRIHIGSGDGMTDHTGIEYTQYEKTGLESGQEYFFRLRAVNAVGESAWSNVTSVVIGTEPAAPTTWSSTTTLVTGDPLVLYWVHNSEDGSSQTYAELELIIDGVKETYTIKNSTDEDEKDKTSYYEINTSSYIEGTTIQWRVRTAGVTKVYGDWSIQRTVDIYAPPTLELAVTNADGESFDTLTSFPLYVNALAGPETQVPIGYHVVITANEAYETVDNVGNFKMVNKDEEVYSKYFDVSDPLVLQLSAGHVDLENNIAYTLKCVVSMDSGLSTEATTEFTVSWTETECEPNAEIGIDKETLVAYIRPYCGDIYGALVPDTTLSVYRREFDGSFTELATGIDNSSQTFITDPHPALDFARYRIVASNNSTGAISYYDVPGVPVGEIAVIIQWDEDWSYFDTTNEDETEQPAWSGSMLRLPYNIDVSDDHAPDVAHVKYTGRKRPVSYYGTQLGETSNWKVEIPKNDIDTLYALRRLAVWMGNVYVREPSGSGYWASITVSFSQTHCELTIPVSFSITRVEGGA